MKENDIKKEIELIKKRNKTVELNKKWETSYTRKICIALLTYIVVLTYTFLTNTISNMFLTSLVPVIGFLLSTLSLNLIRKLWENKINK